MSKEAMKPALQQALDKMAENARELGIQMQPAHQEPVVFYRCNGCGHAYEQVHPTSCDCMEGSSFEKVNYYTSPPAQRKPLTDKQIQKILKRFGWDVEGIGEYTNQKQVTFARAIEAAHGIKENT